MPIYQEENICLLNSSDYALRTVSPSLTSVSSLSNLTIDKFYFDDTTRFLTVNSGSTNSGLFEFYFENTFPGDIVEVDFEWVSVSGNLPRLYFGEASLANSSGTEANLTYFEPSIQGNVEFINQKYIVTNTTYNIAKVAFGLITAYSGVYKIRNFKIRIRRNVVRKRQDVIKKYMITKSSGTWSAYTNGIFTDTPAISITSGVLKLTFDKAYMKNPIAFVQPYNTTAVQYKTTVQAFTNYVTITFYDNTNTLVPADTTVANGCNYYVSVFGEQ